jgi:hypothetical protein
MRVQTKGHLYYVRGQCQHGTLWFLARMEAMGTEAVAMASFEPRKRRESARDGIATFRRSL